MPTTPMEDTLKDVARAVPAEVTEWLGRLTLLYGVPFHYLVPETQMLPRESIRFFFLDPIWIRHLIQGACNVGSNGYGDALIDRAMSRWVSVHSKDKETGGPAKQAAGVRSRLMQQMEGKKTDQPDDTLHWPLTGFLLRSAVVEGWRGLEISADRKTGQDEFAPLQALRIEQLSQDVMLGLFNGRMERLVIRQPQEGLHFGLTPMEGHFTKSIRHPDTGDVCQGKPIDLSDGNLMRDDKKRVVNMCALKERLKQGLEAKLKEKASEKFTSAEFAVQMIESPGEFTFKLEY